MKKNSKIAIAVVAVVAVIAVMVGIFVATRPQTVQGAKEFTVEVTHKDGSTKTFTYHTDEEFVGTVLLAEGLIAGEDGPYGLYVQVVDGEEAVYEKDSSYWAFYVNGEYASTGVDQTPVVSGDVYGLTYTVG
ncbi:MAG: DUF4430 domain-containing protein [Oscillospiraceae bacterium]|nr:DUF4430 domain-containing protein [Oscillospiraceae bacterium]